MSWTRIDFLAILNTTIAKELFIDKEISTYVGNFSDDNKAALLHANGITQESDLSSSLPMLQLIAAFGRKDSVRMRELLHQQQVSSGVRLDYFLPLYSDKIGAGEDVFVAAVKIMLGGTALHTVQLKPGSMVHQVGSNKGALYAQEELSFLEHYVNNSFEIRRLLKSAPNKAIVKPTQAALQYILDNGLTYRDSNDNPAIVFIPGVIDLDNLSIPKMIEQLIALPCQISDIGFFATQGIVWSIILGDVESVNKFIELGAHLTIEDEMGNRNVLAWATATCQVVKSDPDYSKRMSMIIRSLLEACTDNLNVKNNVGQAPLDYLDDEMKFKIGIDFVQKSVGCRLF